MEITTINGNGQQNITIPSSSQSVEHRRVLGSLRERTVVINTNFPRQQSYKMERRSNSQHQLCNTRTYAPLSRSKSERREEKEEMKECCERINEHINNILLSQECSLDERLYDIVAKAEKTQQIHDKIENKLMKLRKMLSQKKTSLTPTLNSQIMPLCESPQRTSFTPNAFTRQRFIFTQGFE